MEGIMEKLVYSAEIQFTRSIEYGTSMEMFAQGQIEIPPEGMRFDQTFDGILKVPELRGEIKGMDYLYIRPDGLFQLNLHAHVHTHDGADIAMSSTGISIQSPESPIAQIRSAISLFTNHESYRWVNFLQLWAMGPFDPINQSAVIHAYKV